MIKYGMVLSNLLETGPFSSYSAAVLVFVREPNRDRKPYNTYRGKRVTAIEEKAARFSLP